MGTPKERVEAAWETADRTALDREVERLAAEGCSQPVLEDALEGLLLKLRAVGADDETQERVMGVWDRVTGWCNPDWHIKTRPSIPSIEPGDGSELAKTG